MFSPSLGADKSMQLSDVPRPRTGHWVAVVVSLGVLLGSGLAYRWIDGRLTADGPASTRIHNRLSALPLELGAWQGTDVPLSDRVLDVAAVDDYVHRRYVNRNSGQVVDLYLSYTIQPPNMLGHRPERCFPAHGWRHVGVKDSVFTPSNSPVIKCKINEFSRSQPVYQGMVVLNYYVLSGRYTAEWTDFWGPRWRIPNLSRNKGVYVAQMQLGGSFMDPSAVDGVAGVLKQFASEMSPHVDTVLAAMRDRSGQ